MEARQSHDEARNEQLITATRSHFSTLTRAVINGEPAAIKRIDDAFKEFLLQDVARANLIRDAARNRDAFQSLLEELIWTEAALDAGHDFVQALRDVVEPVLAAA